MSEYIFIYLLSGFIGWIVDNVYFKKNMLCGDTINKELGICIPIFHQWAFGGITLLFLLNNFDINIVLLSIIAGIIITIFECVIGKISSCYNGRRMWDYRSYVNPMCGGYISANVGLCWVIISATFFYMYPKIRGMIHKNILIF